MSPVSHCPVPASKRRRRRRFRRRQSLPARHAIAARQAEAQPQAEGGGVGGGQDGASAVRDVQWGGIEANAGGVCAVSSSAADDDDPEPELRCQGGDTIRPLKCYPFCVVFIRQIS